jgi:hypothetical protein
MENFRLKVFRAVAKHLNFRKAAEQLCLTQPAVTLQIKALEQYLWNSTLECRYSIAAVLASRLPLPVPCC